MRPVPLTALKGGINRLRTKGGARSDWLYDLLNGYIDQAGSISPREGTIRAAALNGNTVGLCSFNDFFNVFGTSLVGVPGGYKCNLLIHPTDATQTLTRIWFAQPFMGFLYVVAQFANDDIFHYWLQDNGSWEPSTVYKTGDIILPTVENGLAYQAVRDMPANPLWSSQTVIALDAIIEPTQYTGFAYKAIAVAGTSPHTGSTEPIWPATINATIQEFGDFDVSNGASDTSDSSSGSAASLGSTITDRYGNSNVIAGQTGTVGGGGVTVPAQTTVSIWTPGTLYAPGAVVKPSTSQGAFTDAIPNGDFEAGDDGNWTLDSGWSFTSTNQYQGNFCIRFTGDHTGSGGRRATMFDFGDVTPGQSVSVSAYCNPNNSGADLTIMPVLRWYDSSDVFISETPDILLSSVRAVGQGHGYRKITSTGIAPAGATRVRAAIWAGTGTDPNTGYADLVTWTLEQPAAISNFLYEAVQSAAASSGTTEPVWPVVSGNTVIDGGVTWEAIGTSIITWQAIPIMQSGTVEPVWPTAIGNTVKDGIMSWETINRQVTDEKNPNTKAVALAATHVFAGDRDIVPFSGAVDPMDWSSANNAGYLPTGLNNYGANPVAVLALYRSNLMAFNAGGYQMWQVDPDPANMALLDAQPVGSIYTRAAQSVANDLLFLTEVGVRNLGTVGATANMQIGSTGQPVDPIVVAQLKAGTYEPLSLYFPGRGQYWLIFGPQAIVLTINGNSVKSWSRYVFPDAITDWTLSAGVLFLRTAGNLVWQVDSDTLVDDFGGDDVDFEGVMQWPYLDAGALGINKLMVGVDLVGEGQVTIQIGFNQNDPTSFSDNPGFATSQSVTPPYTIAAADTVPGQPIPIPLNAPSYSLILKFGPNQAWQWQAANVYLTDQGGGGATG
jgi:hypothetical protein